MKPRPPAGEVVPFPTRPEPPEPSDFEGAVLSALRTLTRLLSEDVEADQQRSVALAELVGRVEALERVGAQAGPDVPGSSVGRRSRDE